MKVADFISLVTARQTATGTRPRVVLLGDEAIHSLQHELERSTTTEALAVALDQMLKSAAEQPPNRGAYCMTICGVDIHREPSLKAGEHWVAA